MAVRPPGAGPSARNRLLAPTLAVVAAVLLLGGGAVSLYTDLLWFRDVGFTSVFTTVLQTRVLLFVGFGLLMAVIIGTNLTVAYRVRPPFRPMSLEQQNLERYRVAVEPYLMPVLLLASGVFGVFAGLSASARWETWLLWRNATPFGVEDPQFGRDVSYYVMSYPFQRFVLGFLLTAVILSLLAAAATHYLFGALRLQTAGEKVSPAARAHLSVLVGLVLLLKAWAYYLDRFGLVFSDRGPQVQGASYTDINAVLPAKNVLIGVAIICALLAFANIVVRNILLPGGAVALLVVMAIVFGGIYPAYTQRFRVNPNEAEREATTIARNIEATLTAYGLDDIDVETYDATTDADAVEIGTSPSAPVSDVRLLDPNVLSDTYRQLQQIRFYYGFAPQLDVDRYDLGDGMQDYVVGARELDLRQLNPDQRGWIQEHLIYTHGRGIVMAPADRTDVGGRPVFEVANIPPVGPEGFDIDQSRIYFGELSPEYSVVNTEEGEVDGPGDTEADQALFNYDGDGGVLLSSLFRKVVYAIKYREPNLLLSGAIQEDSRIMYERAPRERVEKVAPWLTLDGDPYPAVVDGRLIWIVDGYTTSAGFPYSQRSELGELTADSLTRAAQLPDRTVNYIRNSVKATVDAYTGDVRLYAFDEDEPDPVLASWRKAFPDVVLDSDEISDDLRAHLRYPEDLFKVQRDLFAQYHVTDPRAFYSREDFWEIPDDPASSVRADAAPAAAQGQPQQQLPPGAGALTGAGSEGAQPPYYLFLQLPGDERPRFSLSTVFVARNRPNLSAFMAASSDPEDYGRIRVLAPPSDDIPGPGTIAGAFESNPEVATTLSLLRQGGSRVILGNLLTLPVGEGLLYVEPVYVQASGGESFPLLRRVLVAFGDDVAFEETLGDALERIFGEGAGEVAPTPAPSGTPAPGATPAPSAPATSTDALIAQAQQAFDDGQAALREGDFAAYGEAQDRLQAAIDALARAAGQSGTTAGASPAASPAS